MHDGLDIMLTALHITFHLIATTTLQGRYYYVFPFYNEETEVRLNNFAHEGPI